MNNTMTIESLAARLGCTAEQIKAQFARNASQLSLMANRAEQSGRKVNGYSAEQLREMSARAHARSL